MNGEDVVAMLPTSYGKSFVYQVLPSFFGERCEKGIVLVIGPLTSIMDDQIKAISSWGLVGGVLRGHGNENRQARTLFLEKKEKSEFVSQEIRNGNVDILFGHPEGFFCDEGRKLMKSEVFQKRVVALVVDEAHCIVTW